MFGNSVNKAIKSLNKIITDLDKVVEQQLDYMEYHEETAAQHITEANLCREEVTKAGKISAKIKGLIGE